MRELYSLQKDELFWVNHVLYLQARGYQLRPRYQPDWIPSWRENGHPPYQYEDSSATLVRSINPWLLFLPEGCTYKYIRLIDARRIEDDVKVTIKRVRTWTEEIPIARYLSSEALLSDPRNRSVPIIDVIPLPGDDEWALLVMPFLRVFYDPPFQLLIECIEFFRQVLQVRWDPSGLLLEV